MEKEPENRLFFLNGVFDSATSGCLGKSAAGKLFVSNKNRV
jgi:hypothetical protein